MILKDLIRIPFHALCNIISNVPKNARETNNVNLNMVMKFTVLVPYYDLALWICGL